MGWLARLLRRLFGRRPPARRAALIDLGPPAAQAAETPPAIPEPEPGAPRLDLPPPPPVAPAAHDPPPGVAFVEVDEEEQGFEEEERAPFAEDREAELDARPDLDVIVAERLAHLGEARSDAEHAALSGETRIRLTDPAGPGTLAEALARLEREGRVAGRLEMDAEGEPVMVYTPLNAPD